MSQATSTNIARAMICVLLLGGCAKPAAEAPQQAALQVSVPQLDTREALQAGTPRFWPTPLGDLADSAYCAARLKLPLTKEPSWDFRYSSAEFSQRPPNTLINYDGLLIGTAYSPQIIGLDAKTGRIVFNEDVYKHQPDREHESRPEEFIASCLSPQGLLVGQDGKGRLYCWDIHEAEGLAQSGLDWPPELWVTAEGASAPQSFVTNGGSILANWDNAVRSLDILSGGQDWQSPTLLQPHTQLQGGIAVARDGVIVTWPGYAGAQATSPAGQLLWKTVGVDVVSKATIDDPLQRVYLTYSKHERIECRALHNGELLWAHDFSYLLSPEQRTDMMLEAQHLKPGAQFEPVKAESGELLVLPDGICFSTMSGHVIKLSKAGTVLWTYQGECPVFCWTGFENGIIALELYLAPERTANYFYALLPYSLKRPAWVEQGDELDAPGRRYAARRYVVLDPQTGALIDEVKLDKPPRTGPVPAGDKIVFGYDPLADETPGGFAAYDWLVAEDSK